MGFEPTTFGLQRRHVNPNVIGSDPTLVNCSLFNSKKRIFSFTHAYKTRAVMNTKSDEIDYHDGMMFSTVGKDNNHQWDGAVPEL